jgi:hypothetical protein
MVRGRIAHAGTLTVFVAAIAVLLGASTASADVFQTIKKEDAGTIYTLPDGTIFYGIDPSDPSTGTGVFQPFVRGQRLGSGPNNLPEGEQVYYNTDGAIEFDTKQGQTGGTNWTHSVEFADISGGDSITLVLDANEPTGHNDGYLNIHLDDMKIYLLDAPDVTDYDIATGQLGGEDPVWTMDSAINGDVTIDLYADICPVKGQCGSGHGDFFIEIALADFENLDGKYFYWYNENSLAADGFEEWKVLLNPGTQVPEPTAALLFGLGAVIFGAGSRRRR